MHMKIDCEELIFLFFLFLYDRGPHNFFPIIGMYKLVHWLKWLRLERFLGYMAVGRGGKVSSNPFAHPNPPTIIEPKPTQLLIVLNRYQPN